MALLANACTATAVLLARPLELSILMHGLAFVPAAILQTSYTVDAATEQINIQRATGVQSSK